MSKIICFEGIDGTGKTLQLSLLEARLKDLGYKCASISFPRYSSFFGKEIGALLSSEGISSASHVEPKSMSLWYALDRWNAFNSSSDITSVDFLLINRYTLSSIVYQSARGDGSQASWIEELEHGNLKLPYPDLYIVLDVPTRFTSENLRKKGVRDYIGDKKDVYEADMGLQERSANLYRQYAAQSPNAALITCSDGNSLHAPQVISDRIFHELQRRSFL